MIKKYIKFAGDIQIISTQHPIKIKTKACTRAPDFKPNIAACQTNTRNVASINFF